MSSTPPELTKQVSVPPTPSLLTNDIIVPQDKHKKDDNNKPPAQKLVWDDQTEDMLAAWSDEAACYKWMHDQAFRKYDSINFGVSVPIFIFSTISGTVSVAMPSLVPPEYIDIAQKIVGGVNIIVGIMNAFQSNEKWAQKSESHKQAAAGWGKLERNIRIELKIPRMKRKDADLFHKISRNEYDRLLEQSPTLTDDIIERFKAAFKSNKNLVKPDICDNLQHTEITKPEEEVEEIKEEPIIIEVPVQPQPHEQVLKEIKEMLAESRIVPVGIKDSDLPFAHHHHSSTNKHLQPQKQRHTIDYGFMGIPPASSTYNNVQADVLELVPRKSFLGLPPAPKKEENVKLPSVKELAKKFQTRQSIFHDVMNAANVNVNSTNTTATGASTPSPTTTEIIEVILQDASPQTTQAFNDEEKVTTTPTSSLPSTPRSTPTTPRQHIEPIDLNSIQMNNRA